MSDFFKQKPAVAIIRDFQNRKFATGYFDSQDKKCLEIKM